MSRLIQCGDFKGDLKTLFGLLFLRQHYLQESEEQSEENSDDEQPDGWDDEDE